MKNKNAQTVTIEFSNILTSTKWKLLKIESDRGAEFCNSFSQIFLKCKNTQHTSRFTDRGPNIVEKVIRTIKIFSGNPVIERGIVDWVSDLPSVNKQ